MTTVTGFDGFYSDGTVAKVDAHGNNIAFVCPMCAHPVLAVARQHQRGSSIDNPAICVGCGEQFVVEPRENTQKVVIYRVQEL